MGITKRGNGGANTAGLEKETTPAAEGATQPLADDTQTPGAQVTDGAPPVTKAPNKGPSRAPKVGPGQGMPPPPVAASAATVAVRALAKSADDLEEVIVSVPKAYRLRLDNNVLVKIEVGVQRMARYLASHWYSKANGVKLFAGEPKAAPVTEDDWRNATNAIVGGAFDIEFMVAGIVSKFGLNAGNVRSELVKRVEAQAK